MNSVLRKALLIAVSAMLCSQAHAQTNSDQTVEELRNTLVGVLEALVQKGLLTREQAQAIVADAQSKAQATAKTKADQDTDAKDAVRVTYVPQIVRDEISKQVSAELKPEVTKDVIAQAKADKWGVPGALPDWVSNIKLSGDVRFRFENDHFATGNLTYKNYQAINDAGGETKAGTAVFFNDTVDRFRERLRVHLGIDAKLADNISAGIRLATGSLTFPVTTNQTLGNYADRYQFAIDQAYLRYDATSPSGLPWLSLSVGRIPNPWISTDLVWYSDLQFEGMASTLRYAFGDNNDDKNPRNVFLTIGALPLQEINLSPKDKWLFGGELGLSWPWSDGGRAVLAGTYYYYDHIVGVQNAPGSTLMNYTAPTFVQKGNTMFDILNDTDPSTNLYALSTNYHLVDVTAIVDIPAFNHLITLTADYVKNIGYDQQQVLSHFVSTPGVPDDIAKQMLGDKQTKGYQVEMAFGSRTTGKRGTWRSALTYKYLERDAVLDAFTDSDFHLGGTNAKGYILRGDWWFRDHNWVTLRYMSSDEIKHYGPTYYDTSLQSYVRPTDSPTFGVDLFLLELNGQF